jgi:diaminopropionate ammonia-lyase
LQECGGPRTTPSGAAGMAGALQAASPDQLHRFVLSATSRVLVVITEIELDKESVDPVLE